MIGRIIHVGIAVLATAAAVVLVTAVFLALVEPENTGGDPTDAPSGERANPCAPDDRVCNEWIEVQEPER